MIEKVEYVYVKDCYHKILENYDLWGGNFKIGAVVMYYNRIYISRTWKKVCDNEVIVMNEFDLLNILQRHKQSTEAGIYELFTRLNEYVDSKNREMGVAS